MPKGFKKDGSYSGKLFKKGEHKAPKTEFKKGFIPKTAFKKGHQTWNKGKKCPLLMTRKYKGDPNKTVEHHLSYSPEIKVKVLRKEHFIITRLNWFKSPISRGFIRFLRNWIKENKNQAKEL